MARQRDKDEDGRLNFHEYLTSLFRLIKKYDKFSSSTHEASRSRETQVKQSFARLYLDHDGYLSANELKPIINDLHLSERFFARQQADDVISQADADKDGRLSLKEMIDNPNVEVLTDVNGACCFLKFYRQ
ncbi:calmodulin-like [Zingiber officinale]|uniref:calmodulin-like n=1 Tax=Zingiber officinale TaxID=94328 RepID=UPI001C4B0669|nr:calmodulin-like [Zingiber officinale]